MAEEKSKRILIVEDEKSYARALTLKLQNAGFEVATAGDGEAALALAEDGSFDLILCDLIMPKMNGFAFLEALATKKVKTPVIALSNLGQEDDEKKVQALGAVDLLSKSNMTLAGVIDRVQAAFS